MSLRVIAFCATPYQILVANRIIEQYYNDSIVTLIIADTINDVDSLVKRIKQEKRYESVSLWRIKETFQFSKLRRIVNATVGDVLTNRYLREYPEAQKEYDVYLYSNYGLPMIYLGYSLKKVNPYIKCELFEDGFNSYSKYYGDYINSDRLVDRITRRLIKNTNTLYLFNPDILDWSPTFPVKKINANFDDELTARINRIFEYEKLIDDYKRKVIFFEESYYADGTPIDDIEAVSLIAEIVGKNNIIIKIHPRNSVNRFRDLGFYTNENLSIPWEVISLNSNFENSVFVTFASNAAMNPFFIFGKRTAAILLFKCTKNPASLRRSIVEYDQKLCEKHPDVFKIPKSYDELKILMNQFIMNGRNEI